MIDATATFDGVSLSAEQLRVSDDEFAQAQAALPAEVLAAIETAIDNHRRYNERLLPPALQLFDIADGIGLAPDHHRRSRTGRARFTRHAVAVPVEAVGSDPGPPRLSK